jgi:uncharacterized membrane protein
LNLTQYKALFIVITSVLALLVASPALQWVLVSPQTKFFTELSLLGPGHTTANYPYSILQNEKYSVFLGLTNQLGYCAYYQVEVKFRNETESAPDGVNLTPSSLPSLYNMTTFVANKESLEIPITFSFNYSVINNVQSSQVTFNSLKLNDVLLNLQGDSSQRNSTTNVLYGNLIFELWLYNSPTGGFLYNDRFVDLKFNMTSTT